MSKLYEGFDALYPTVILKRFRTRREAEQWLTDTTYSGWENGQETELFDSYERANNWRSNKPSARIIEYAARANEPRRAYRLIERCKHTDCREHPEIMQACLEAKKRRT